MTRSRTHRTAALLAALALLIGLSSPVAAVGGARYVELTNQKRASVGLGPVALHAAVDQVSIERAAHMARHDDFSHDMNYVASRLTQLGVCYTGYGEIIAYTTTSNYDESNSIERWWVSTGHKAIMTGNYTHAGGSHERSTATNRMYAVMVFVKLCGASTPPPPSSTTQINRIAGSDRYATAAAISRAYFSGGASTAFVATGASFPDALSGAPAAATLNAPILLTAQSSLPPATATELARLRPSRIVVLGGSAAVSDTVLGQLRSYAPQVDRWWGANRYATASAVARAAFAPGVERLYVASGRSFPDALSGGAVAGMRGGPLLLVDRTGIPAETAAALSALRPKSIVVLGGSGVISDGVRSDLARYTSTGTVWRLAGADRFATSVAVSRSAYGTTSDAVFVATGNAFPDGLAGGPIAALVPGPLLLVEPNRLPGIIAEELVRLGPDQVYVLGGTGAVSNGVVSAIDGVLP